MFRYLVEEIQIIFSLNRIIFICVPFSFQEFNYSFSQINIEWTTIVKMLHQWKEFHQVVWVFKISVKFNELLNDFDKHTHYVRENGYTRQQNHTTECPFKVCIWVIISESNCRESCKGKIDKYHALLEGWNLCFVVFSWTRVAWLDKKLT